MAKLSVADWDTVANNNTDVGGTNIDEGCSPSGMNNAMRNIMAQIKAGIGVSFQAHDVDTAKLDVAQTWTQTQTFGKILTAYGTAASPGIAFDGDTDTGLYRSAANTVGIAAAGVNVVSVTTGSVSLASNVALSFAGTGAATTRTNLGLAIGADVQAYDADTAKTDVIQSWSATQTFNGITLLRANVGYGINGSGDLTGGTDGFFADSANSYTLRHTRGSTATRAIEQFYNPNGLVGNISTSGSGTSYATTSDGRLKVNRVDLNTEFDTGAMFDALNPVAYDWLNSFTLQPTGQRGHGLIAQEVYGILPDAVMVGQGDAGADDFVPWSLDYTKLVPFLIAEVKSLRERLAAAGL